MCCLDYMPRAVDRNHWAACAGRVPEPRCEHFSPHIRTRMLPMYTSFSNAPEAFNVIFKNKEVIPWESLNLLLTMS